jgi:hypothetical protein
VSLETGGRYLPVLDLRPDSDTAGLITVADGRVLYMGYLWPTPPPPPYPTYIPTLPKVDTEVHGLLNHFTFYAEDPWRALSVYAMRLNTVERFARDENDDMLHVRIGVEQSLWRRLYHRTLRQSVMSHVEHDLESSDHMWWRGPYPDTYTGRPRVKLPGYNYLPVYRLLWPLERPHLLIPDGRPRKISYLCNDKHSDDPAQDFRMCVNPHHFEESVPKAWRLDQHTRRGVANELLQFRFPLSQISIRNFAEDGKPLLGTCPNGHDVGEEVIRNYNEGVGSNRFICYPCKVQAYKIQRAMGRETARTRNRWEPTLAELDEMHVGLRRQLPDRYTGPDSLDADIEELKRLMVLDKAAESGASSPGYIDE